jgi:oligoribonuclease (3'-5' exoribonuclease)
MAQTIPLILDFIAQQLNLSGIAERITKIIHRIRKPIDQVIDRIIDFITNKVKKIAGKLLGKDKHNEKTKDPSAEGFEFIF